MAAKDGPRVLLLTTYPSTEKKTWNSEVYDELERRGVSTTFRSWKEPPLQSEELAKYTHIVTLTCSYYIDFIEDFDRFMKDVMIPTQKRCPKIQFLNDPSIVLWNSNKIYLNDLQQAKLVDIPTTLFISPHQPMEYLKLALSHRRGDGPVIVKPSVSASGRDVHMIQNPCQLTQEDESALLGFSHQPNSIGSIVVQDFEPAIRKGEYSLIFLGHTFVSAMLKKPAEGDYRSNTAYGSTITTIDSKTVPQNAVDAGRALLSYIEESLALSDIPSATKHRISYARVDGAIKNDGTFTLMEVELLEPSIGLHLEGGEKTLKLFCDLICK